MVLKPFHTDALQELCSKDQLELLDSIDTLRSQGISHYVSLPQIIVCGDQSSGKSSVLEAISGVSFPIQSNLCMRFPTELILRKTTQVGVIVSIVAHQSSSDVEKLTLGAFHEKLDNLHELPTLIENAKAAMGVSSYGKAFSKHILKIEVSGPDHPHLTIVDLPGLIHSETKQQSSADIALVKEVVRTYMSQQRSIILAVVSAKNDYANQIVLSLARAADKEGTRMLGVITKPDTLLTGSGSEAMYIALEKNQNVEFRLGWHVLKNMDSETGNFTLADRNSEEEQYFSQGAWQALSRSILGIEALRHRLSHVLLHQIVSELPSLVKDIEVKSDACQDQLEKLGQPRASSEDQRMYLFSISQSLQALFKAAADGVYNDSFFGDALSLGYEKRIRAVVQNSNIEFAERMTVFGHTYAIGESSTPAKPSRNISPKNITKDQYIDLVQILMQRTRGRELPGTFNPMIIVDLFRQQSSPWEKIARDHIGTVWKAVKTCIIFALKHVADQATSTALLRTIFDPALDEVLNSLHTRVSELLKSHQHGHPITYNHYFTENLQKARNQRTRDACTQIVALKRFIDDVAVEVIEEKLIYPLADMFSPRFVAGMKPELVTLIAGECEENRIERDHLKVQLDILSKGMDTCKHFIGVGGLVTNTPTHKSNSFSPSIVREASETPNENSDTEYLEPLVETEPILDNGSIEGVPNIEPPPSPTPPNDPFSRVIEKSSNDFFAWDSNHSPSQKSLKKKRPAKFKNFE